MKNAAFRSLVATALLATISAAHAAQATNAKDEFMALFDKIQAKMEPDPKTGKPKVEPTEAVLAPELKEFDAILARHKGEKTDDVAQVLYMKATLYLQVLEDPDKAVEAMKQLQKDFPDTKYGKQAPAAIASIGEQAAGLKIQKSLAVGSAFPQFTVKDTAGAEFSPASYKGKVVMIDFWAMWCGPCVAELPNVVKAYKQYHDQGFEIVGISLDNAGDGAKLAAFTKDNGMPWRQYFDGKYWQNELAVKFGVNSIPASYLLDGEGKIIAKGDELRGDGLGAALAKALAKK